MGLMSVGQRVRSAAKALFGPITLDANESPRVIPLTAFWVSATPWISAAVYAVTKLEIIELLAARPRTLAELVVETGANPDALGRLLRALTRCGYFQLDQHDKYQLTPVSDQLRADAPESLRHWTILLGESWREAGRGLLDCVRTGRSGFECVTGEPMWEYYEHHPHDRAVFDAAMNEVTEWQSKVIADALPLTTFRHVVDVGCGRGALLAECLARQTDLRGTAFDRPETHASLQQRLVAKGVDDRTRVLAGSFFEPAQLPNDADTYLIKHVLHDWDDVDATRILKAVREAMPVDAMLYVIEGLRDRNPHSEMLLDWLDIEQLIVTKSGRERTEAEFSKLLADSGFELQSIQDTSVADVSILAAKPI